MDEKRYKSIMERDFEYSLELYLFHLILDENEQNATPEKFMGFNPDNKLIDDYRKACQLKINELFKGKKIGDIDARFTSWYKEKDLKEYKNLFYIDFKEKLPFPKLKQMFTDDQTKNQCHYCDIHEHDIEKLITKSDIQTKRLLTRGRHLEIDRKNPCLGYTEDNIVLSCYWCNNAKTDEFSYEEFKNHIAPGIKEVWEKRLGYKLHSPAMENFNNEKK